MAERLRVMMKNRQEGLIEEEPMEEPWTPEQQSLREKNESQPSPMCESEDACRFQS